MFRSFDVAVSGLRSHQLYLDVTSNNLANVNSDGFKASRAEFEDKLNQLARGTGMTPMPQPNGARNAAMVGLGVATKGIEGVFDQGAFKITNIATDLGVSGNGFFVLQGGDGPRYTRNGNFSFDASGALRAGDGSAVLGVDNRPIQAPRGIAPSSSLAITGNGQVSIRDAATGGVTALGTIKLARFTNDLGLERVGNTEFRATAASGAAVEGVPGANGLGSVVSGVTEASNVDMGAELSNLIMAQRGFSANAKVMTATDELVDRLNQMK